MTVGRPWNGGLDVVFLTSKGSGGQVTAPQSSTFAAGDARGLRQYDLEGPNLEIGYYEVDLSAAAEKYWGQK